MRLGVASCDAGAANQIFAYLSHIRADVTAFLSGPAEQIAQQFMPNVKRVHSAKELIERCDTVITGTGWSSSLEHETRILCFSRRKWCVAVLDHWTNYVERFSFAGQLQLPNELWVFDPIAKQLASNLFPDVQVRQQYSAYEHYVVSQVSKDPTDPDAFLYICEPIRMVNDNKEPIEFRYLNSFLEHVSSQSTLKIANILLRLHPSEEREKYLEVLKKFTNLNITVDEGSLVSALEKCGNVVGISSYALYLSHRAGRKVFSSLQGVKPKNVFDMNTIIPMEKYDLL